MDRTHVTFKPILIGCGAEETVWLINNEDFEMGFAVDEESRFADGRLSKLEVTPMTGVVPPREK